MSYKISASPINLTLGCILVAALVAAMMFFSASAQAEVTKFFNKRLSLTGNCSTAFPDDIPDPGCPDGPHPPEGPFKEPSDVATDPYGNVYVVNRSHAKGEWLHHIDIFDPNGHYIAQVQQPGAVQVEVDSTGHLYVAAHVPIPGGFYGLVRFDPTVYNPAAGEIVYGSPPLIIEGEVTQNLASGDNLVVDPATDHLYFPTPVSNTEGKQKIREYAAAVDGQQNDLLDEFVTPGDPHQHHIALDSKRDRFYSVQTGETSLGVAEIIVFEREAPYQQLMVIDGAETPAGKFQSSGRLTMAVDETNGHLFVCDCYVGKQIYEFDELGKYVGRLKQPPTVEADYIFIGIDNSPTSPNHRFLFVPSGVTGPGHVWAYEPAFEATPPVVESVSLSGLTEDEAVLRARINPRGIQTHWKLEYVTEEAFAVDGFASAEIAGQGEIGPGSEGVSVAAPAVGLVPGVAYRFRAHAENACAPGGCVTELEGSFRTFRPHRQTESCANQPLRVGASAALPDCRAYELVTPADTASLMPYAPATGTAVGLFHTPPASPDGNSLAFMFFGGSIPGLSGTGGGLNGDTYRAVRGGGGWTTDSLAPSGTQAAQTQPGGLSADHSYQAIQAFLQGTLLNGAERADFIRHPDGSFRLTALGSIGRQPNATTHYIAPGGSHILFTTSEVGGEPAVPLEPDAPPAGTEAIYDRTADGALHVVSLLPGDQTPFAGENAEFIGASEDGSSVAFALQGEGADATTYVRVDNEETVVAAPPGSAYAGFSNDGRYFFFVASGDLHRLDLDDGGVQQLTELGDVDPVNISSDGSVAYFLSEGLSPDEPNLYRWDGSGLRFVATVTDRDAEGEPGLLGPSDGLGLWLQAAATDSPPILSSRTTRDGSVFVFKSRANLTPYDSSGHAEIYRYDAADASLICISCGGTGQPDTADADLVASLKGGSGPLANSDGDPSGINRYSAIPNLSADGARIVFETNERLVASDNDGVMDVYEWEKQGKGSCDEPGGCLFLISSGQSARPNHLFGVSASGDDVFILTSDLLTPQDKDESPSVYDARVGGGFALPAAPTGECLGEACQPAAVEPQDATPTSSSYRGKGNVTSEPRRPCRKGKKLVRRGGKSRCQRPKKKSHRRKSQKQRGAERRTH